MPIINQPAGLGGGSYTPPTAREQLHGATVAIANAGRAALTWDTKDSGTTLLNLTAPAAPTIVTSGVYAVAVQVNAFSAMTAGGVFQVEFEMDAAGDDALITAKSSGAVAAASLQPFVAVFQTYYIPAGGVVAVTVTNLDGVQSVDFRLVSAVVQRLS